MLGLANLLATPCHCRCHCHKIVQAGNRNVERVIDSREHQSTVVPAGMYV